MLSDIEAELESEIRALRAELIRERRARELRTEISKLAAATSAQVTRAEVARVLTEGAVSIFGAADVVTAFVDDEVVVRLVRSSGVTPELDWIELRLDSDLPICEVLRGERNRLEIHDPSAMQPWPLLVAESKAANVESLAIGRIGDGEVPDAALGVSWHEAHTMDASEAEMFGLFISLAAPAFERARRTESDNELSSTVQTWLREGRIADVPGLDTATLYEPGHDVLRVGGDWFDVVELEGGAVAVVIGDVVGHDVRAAIEMSQVRHVLATHLRTSGDPVTSLTATDDYLRTCAPHIMATALVAAFDRDGVVSLASAGHPPPVIASSDGSTRLGECGLGPPLGTGIGGFSSRSGPMKIGDVFVSYTDGVVESRETTVDDGIERLRRELGTIAASDDPSPDAVMAMLQEYVDVPWRIDDAAAVIVRVTG